MGTFIMDNIPRVQVSSTVKWKNPFAIRGGEGFVLRHNSLAPSSGRVLPVKEPTLRLVPWPVEGTRDFIGEQ